MNLWNEFLSLWSVNRTLFTVLNYPMSYVEFFGTLFNLASVYLATRNRVGTWPVGLVGVALFLALFYQLRLYADTFEQVYYILTGFYGWWLWSRADREKEVRVGQLVPERGNVGFSPLPSVFIALGITLVLSIVAGYANTNLHVWMPKFFPEAASFAYVDAATTVASFTATILMARRRTECWVYWIIIDIIGTWLYYAKGVPFVALLYLIFTGLAINGLWNWLKEEKRQ